MKEFSARLRELRKEAGYSQAQAARLLGLCQQSYARYEINTGEPSLETLVKIAKLFCVSTDHLVGLSEI
ncbi:MAG: helix-turn-helix domain-containing protein [Clostridiales bacterium]|jgi:transcriptional regulator with XRE-family HTH domain|nr:helix-turn-helix domain-containing protein [Clostridiales bacterium]